MATSNFEVAEAAIGLGLAITRLRARLRLESGTSRSGWTISQLSVLTRIIEAGSTTTSALTQSEHVRHQSIAAAVGALRAGGLVTSRPDPHDGRKTLLSATPDGIALLRTITRSRDAWLAQAIRTLDEDARESLIEAIPVIESLAACDPAPAPPSAPVW